MLKGLPVLLAALVVSLPPQSARTHGDKIFGLTRLHQIKLSVSLPEWNVLQTSAPRTSGGPNGGDYRGPDGRLIHIGSGFGGFFPWVRADFSVDGQQFKDVGIRYQGNLSIQSSSAAAPLYANFKLKIDLHGTRGTWDGQRTFNFQAGVVDTSRMRDAIAFAIFRAAGVPASRTAYAELYFTVPERYQDTKGGLYTIVEDINGRFLERVLPPGTGLLMKPEGLRGGIQKLGDSWSVYATRLRPDREATPHEQQRVMEFADLISQSDPALFRSKIGSYLDIDQFLRFVAVNALIANWDSYLGGGHNFYLYLDPADDKFRFIPWDEDLAMGARMNQNLADITRPFSGDQPLIYWVLNDPDNAQRYREIVKEIVAKVFNKTELFKMVDALEQVGSGRGPSPRTFLESRVNQIEQAIAGWK
jgi:spore coat protein CotH